MDLANNLQLTLIILIAGIAVAFVALIVLAWIIKGYSSAINQIKKKMDEKNSAIAVATIPAEQNGIPEEVVAVISAAVYMMYGSTGHTVKSIQRAKRPTRSVWGTVGILENTRPF